jgi:hypothetical protein
MERLFLAGALLAIAGTPLAAQEFRVYTRVYDLRSASGAVSATKDAPVIARSLTLFHAGKVYDYIDEIGEVIVFDPVHHQFVILNGSRMISTTVDLDEVTRLVKLAEQETESYAKQLADSGDPKQAMAIQPLRFQLAPQFDQHFDESQEKLTLSSRYFRYEVQCATVEMPQAVAAYIRYADWTARLNSVLHPRALLPGPRLMLNEALLARGRMPVEVDLQADFESLIHMKAQHQIHWMLDAKDRSLINHWETLLKSADKREVSFREYQRAVLKSRSN